MQSLNHKGWWRVVWEGKHPHPRGPDSSLSGQRCHNPSRDPGLACSGSQPTPSAPCLCVGFALSSLSTQKVPSSLPGPSPQPPAAGKQNKGGLGTELVFCWLLWGAGSHRGPGEGQGLGRELLLVSQQISLCPLCQDEGWQFWLALGHSMRRKARALTAFRGVRICWLGMATSLLSSIHGAQHPARRSLLRQSSTGCVCSQAELLPTPLGERAVMSEQISYPYSE